MVRLLTTAAVLALSLPGAAALRLPTPVARTSARAALSRATSSLRRGPAAAVAPYARQSSALSMSDAASTPEPAEKQGIMKKMLALDLALPLYFFFWCVAAPSALSLRSAPLCPSLTATAPPPLPRYLGNYHYNIANKRALSACGGSAGFPMIISTAQLGVGMLYALFMWVAPDARARPKTTRKDIVAMLPVSICAAGAHSASVFALGAGAVSFAQIVKASEPAFAAVLGTLFYGAQISLAKWLCLIPVIGGVCLASVKELDFAWSALAAAGIANIFAAIKGNENKKLMTSPGIAKRIGTLPPPARAPVVCRRRKRNKTAPDDDDARFMEETPVDQALVL